MNNFLKNIFFVLITFCFSAAEDRRYTFSSIVNVPDLSFFNHVYTGLDILEQKDFDLIKDKNIGIFCNHTAVTRNNKHILDILGGYDDINIEAIFEPEYGIWGMDDSRAKLIGSKRIDPVTGAKVFNLLDRSLYPPNWIMKSLDVIVIDIQDTGARFSTFISSITKLFESASDHKIPIIVLDRPNPINGLRIEGPLPREEYQSYEAYHLLPIRHGMTIGEILLMVNEMGWVKDLKRVDLKIIPMANWDRNQYIDDTKIPWKKPAPYIKDLNTLIMYSGMDLLRGTNLNIGFGTESPYLIFGSPWLATKFFKEKLEMLNLPGVSFKEIEYRPTGSPYYDRVPKYNGMSCSGLKVSVVDRKLVKPIEIATSIMTLISQLHPREFRWESNGYIDKLFGSNQLRLFVAQRKPPDYLSPQYMHDEIEFSKFRETFLLYKN
tara:strand:+ start:3028 stop:4332 length:1305 start_codon:yes stop_codon:yes gene_type:complete